MFDIGWTELVVVAIVAILVVGPKDLPGMLRGFGKTLSSLRRMGRDFQRQFDEALRETELDEIRKAANKPLKPLEDVRKSVQSYQDDMREAIGDKPPAASGAPEKKADAGAKSATSKPKQEKAKAKAKAAASKAKTGKSAAKAGTASGGTKSGTRAARPKAGASTKAGAAAPRKTAKPAARKTTGGKA